MNDASGLSGPGFFNLPGVKTTKPELPELPENQLAP